MALPRLFKRSEEIDPPGVTPAWLVRSVNAIAWLFVVILVMTVFLRSLDIARDKAVPLEVTHAGTWVGQLAFFFPLFAPLVLAAIALPWTAKVIIPAFCTFDWKDKRQRAPKVWCGVIAVCVAIVTMTSGFPLYHGAFNERFKQEAVKLEQVDQSRAKLQADLSAIEADLKDITNPALTTYQAQASREGAAAWAKRVAIAKAQNDWQADAIERALASAERGDQLRKQRSEAIKALAVAPTKAAVMEQVKGTESYGSDKLVDFINAWWGFALFIVIELCALIAGWIAYMMMMLRTRQLADWDAVHAAPVPEAGIDTLAIEDQTDTWQVQPQDVQYDEDGNELVKVRRKKEEYYRRKSTPKKKQKDDPRAAQMFDGLPEDGQNPQNEVSDVAAENNSYSEPLVGETDSDDGSGQREGGGFQEAISGEYPDDRGSGAREESTQTLPEIDVQSESLSHAQEDQQAEQEAAGLDVEGAFQVGGEEASLAAIVADHAHEAVSETDGSLDAPLSSPDEQALWTEATETEEPANDGSQTRLPDGEGIVVWDDETDPTIKELLRKTEAAE